MPSDKNSGSLPPEYLALLEKLDTTERRRIESLFNRAFLAVRQLTTVDLWEQPELGVTYWILLLSGVNQEEEMEIAQALLVWKAFIAKDSARVLCIPHSDREEFKLCSLTFGASRTPTLVLSDSPNMADAITIQPELLFSLANKKGGLQRFFTQVHSSIENGDSLTEIKSQLRTNRFWSGVKLVYSEVKGLISIKIG